MQFIQYKSKIKMAFFNPNIQKKNKYICKIPPNKRSMQLICTYKTPTHYTHTTSYIFLNYSKYKKFA